MSGWVAMLPLESASGVAALRRVPEVRSLIAGDVVWLQGKRDPEVERLLAGIPGAVRYSLVDGGLLTPIDSRLPVARLTQGDWKPIDAWFELCLPQSTLVTPSPVTGLRLSLVRSAAVGEQPPAALLASFADWAEYVETAPRMRWDRLRFAASKNAQALIVGTPLPPISGLRFWQSHDLFIECGWHWFPHVEPAIVCQVLHLEKYERLLWFGGGETQRFQEPDLIVTRRSAVRTTQEALASGH